MERYRDRGLKLTPQRIAIFDYLADNKEHPSADEIYRAVAGKFPTMSFATVYNTLSALRDRGVVREITIDPAKRRYDPDTKDHDHFICIECRRLFDVPRTGEPQLPARLRDQFTVTARQVEFHGICADCKKQAR